MNKKIEKPTTCAMSWYYF